MYAACMRGGGVHNGSSIGLKAVITVKFKHFLSWEISIEEVIYTYVTIHGELPNCLTGGE